VIEPASCDNGRSAERSDRGSTALQKLGYQCDRALPGHNLNVPAIDAQHTAVVSLRTRGPGLDSELSYDEMKDIAYADRLAPQQHLKG
jgi:hypothetical protein